MARNLIEYVEAIRQKMVKGYPDGIEDVKPEDINLLFMRIAELERGLFPFAHVAQIERQAKSTTEMVMVYRKDCEIARELVLTQFSRPIPKEEPLIPAV